MNSYLEKYWSWATGSHIGSLGVAYATKQPSSTASAATPLPSLVNQTGRWNNQYHSTVVHLPTPFLFFPPDTSTTEASALASLQPENKSAPAISDGSWNEYGDYDEVENGVVPSELFEHLVTESNYKLQYPELGSCLPGKPTPSFHCGVILPGYAFAAPHLTLSSSTTITTAGCFHPGACPIPTLQAVTPTPTSNSLGPDKNFPSIHPISQSSTRAESLSKTNPQAIETHQNFKLSSSSPTRQPEVDPATTSPLPTKSDTGESNLNIASLIIGAFGGPHGSESQNPDFTKGQSDGASIPMSFDSKSATEASFTRQSPTDIRSITPDQQGSQSSLKVPEGVAASLESLTIAMAGTSNLIVGSKTIAPGDLAVNTQGLKISLVQPATAGEAEGVGTGLLDSAGSTIVRQIPSLTFGTAILSTNSLSQYVIGSKTLTAGSSAVTIAGQRVSLAPEGDEIIIGSSTIPVPAPASNKIPLPAIVINGQTFSENSASFYVIGGQTLSPGSKGIALPQSAIPFVSSVILPDSTVITGSTAIITPSPSIIAEFEKATLAGHVVTPSPAAISIEGTILSAGGPGVTISGTPVSVAPGGSLLVGNKTLLGTETAATIAGHVVPLEPAVVSIGSTTLSAGGQGVTIAGTPVSLATGGSLVIGNKTVGVGTANVTGVGFTGGAKREGARREGWRIAWTVFVGCWLFIWEVGVIRAGIYGDRIRIWGIWK